MFNPLTILFMKVKVSYVTATGEDCSYISPDTVVFELLYHLKVRSIKSFTISPAYEQKGGQYVRKS